MPDGEWEEKDEGWQVFCRTLSSLLQDVPVRGIPANVDAWFDVLATWQPFIEKTVEYNDLQEEREKKAKQWDLARTLLWCTRYAVANPQLEYNEIDRSLFAISEKPDYVEKYESWAWNCIHLWIGKRPHNRIRMIPVALSEDDLIGKTGQIALLVLEVLQGGAGQLFHHPQYALRTYAHSNFEAAIRDAWTAARQLINSEDESTLCDGRWHLLFEQDKQPVQEVAGRSAGGAAAWGWWFALQDKIPDEGIIILTQVTSDGSLEGVGSIPEKVEAIVANGRFDTIVVADETNLQEAERALRKSGAGKRIRVVKYDHKRGGQ